MATDTPLDSLYERANDIATKPSLSPETERKIDAQWGRIHSGDVDITHERTFEAFLVGFLADRRREVGKDGVGDKLCGGSMLCDAKRGRVPAGLQNRASEMGDSGTITPSDASAYLRDNPQCHAVSDALEAFYGERETAEEALREIIRLGKQGSASGADVDDSNIPT